MKTVCNLLFILLSFYAYAQKPFNLNLETVANNKPVEWDVFGSAGYQYFIDTTQTQNGKVSAVIEYHGNAPDFKAWAYKIPANYKGKKIKLSGYIKTENVTDGYAGLWLRIDPRLAFDNMNDRGITGTTDWAKYEIELDYDPEKATNIVLGGLLVGKGKMWIDNFAVFIDGVPLKDAPAKDLYPAEKDTEFDKGSGITIPELNEQLIGDLEILGHVWGFLKYHHPAIGTGNYNWDYELFRFLPKYLKNKNTTDRDKILTAWIDQYGLVLFCAGCTETSDDAIFKPDHSWIEKSNLSSDLKQKLNYIRQNRHQGSHFYIGMVSDIGNPEFKHENPYSDMPYPDDGFRLLALYKYWNMIEYFFPYKHLIGKSWSSVLKEYIPKFIQAKNELEYELAAVQLIGEIHDTHANLWGGNNAVNEWKGNFYPPFHVRFIENKLVVTDYYNPELKDTVGLEIGDIITSINGKSIEDLIQEISPFYPASNEPTRLRNISTDLLRSDKNNIEITYLSNNKTLTKKLELYPPGNLNMFYWYRRPDGKCYKMLEDNIGYITLANIKEEDISPIKELFKNAKGIIIDIRNYPSTFVPFLLGSYFISKPTAFVKFTIGSVNDPGAFTFGAPLEIENDAEPFKGKLVVLVNELTQSQAEYTAMAFRAGDNTTIIGSTTAGADGNVSAIYLPGGLRTMISGIGVNYPDGGETQRIGIVPDIEVQPTIAGIRAGRDEVLEKAIEMIKQ